MTKGYALFSWTYRIGLGLFSGFYAIMSHFVPGFAREDDPSAVLVVVFCITVVAVLTALHGLKAQNGYRIYVQVAACLLVSASLAFLLHLACSIARNGDSNILINVVVAVAAVANGTLLFYLINDRKYAGGSA